MANRAQLYKYRGNKCASCGMSVEEMVGRFGTFNRMLAFHHIDPESKHKDYKKLIKRRISSEQIDETDKCVLLCVQCHGIAHAQNINGDLRITIQLTDRTVLQTMKGWYLIDQLDKKLTFITNERLLIDICIVKLGGNLIGEFCVLELEQEENLIRWINKIDDYKTIEIYSATSNKLLLSIRLRKAGVVDVEMELGFPVLLLDFEVEKGNSKFIWLRNGMILTKEGEIYTRGQVKFPMMLSREENV